MKKITFLRLLHEKIIFIKITIYWTAFNKHCLLWTRPTETKIGPHRPTTIKIFYSSCSYCLGWFVLNSDSIDWCDSITSLFMFQFQSQFQFRCERQQAFSEEKFEIFYQRIFGCIGTIRWICLQNITNSLKNIIKSRKSFHPCHNAEKILRVCVRLFIKFPWEKFNINPE